MRRPVLIAAFAAVLAALPGCGAEATERAAPAAGEQRADGGFDGGDCHGITDADIARATGAAMFTKVLVNDTGCFWQENTVIGTFGAGMGISTWWYRGSDMDVERELEKKAGRTLTEISMDGNKGFKACSVRPSQRAPCEARQPCDCAAGVNSTALATASSSTPPRNRPKPAPSSRSGRDSGVAWISMRIRRASNDHTTSAAMKATMKAAPRLSPEPGEPTGR